MNLNQLKKYIESSLTPITVNINVNLISKLRKILADDYVKRIVYNTSSGSNTYTRTKEFYRAWLTPTINDSKSFTLSFNGKMIRTFGVATEDYYLKKHFMPWYSHAWSLPTSSTAMGTHFVDGLPIVLNSAYGTGITKHKKIRKGAYLDYFLQDYNDERITQMYADELEKLGFEIESVNS